MAAAAALLVSATIPTSAPTTRKNRPEPAPQKNSPRTQRTSSPPPISPKPSSKLSILPRPSNPTRNPVRINTYRAARKCWALLTSSTRFSLRGIDKGRLTVFSDGAGGTMAEVGLLPFARVALQVATQVLPPYRTRFSKHQFTQPQLLPVLCLIRFESCTLPLPQVPLKDPRQFRAPLKLQAS